MTSKRLVQVLVTVTHKNVANSTKCNCIFTVRVPYAYVIPEGNYGRTLVDSSICEITQISEKLRIYSSRSSKIIDFGANRRRICNFLL